MENIFYFLLLLCLTKFSCCSFPEVKSMNGWIRGVHLKSRNNRSFSAFKGIPFAEPPVGELRFKAPKTIQNWNGIINATEDKSLCIQKNTLFLRPTEIEGEEDCLYLNVFSPLHAPCKSHQLPVLVYMYYGGYIAGSSQSAFHGPEYFMDEDVVLVTFNYRLGAFGFLSTEDDAAPGNWGLKDQNLALRWIQDNIEHFGGNKNNVTIFGQSAGAVSVHFHMISPLSKGLFQAAISQSGTSFTGFARPIPGAGITVTRQQAGFVGCDSNATTTDLIECLRTIDAHVLADSVDNFKFFATYPLLVFLPSIEVKTDLNPYPFLTEDPITIVKSGNFNKVPWIVSFVQNEGLVLAAELIRINEYREELNANFDAYNKLLLSLSNSLSADQVDSVWSDIKNFYINGSTIDINDPDTLHGFINMYGDRYLNYPDYRAVDLHLTAGHKPIWVLSFNYKGQFTYGDLFAKTTDNANATDWGVSHCDDLLYLFPSAELFPPLNPTSSDEILSKIMVYLWKYFAQTRTTSPEIGWSPVNDCNYQDDNQLNFCYLNISGSYEANKSTFQVENSFLTERLQFWREQPLTENALFDS